MRKYLLILIFNLRWDSDEHHHLPAKRPRVLGFHVPPGALGSSVIPEENKIFQNVSARLL